jgi:hypothetical protein
MVRAHIQCIMYTDYITSLCEVWFYIKWNIYMTILKTLCIIYIMYFTSDYSHGTYLFATLDFTLYISYKTTFWKQLDTNEEDILRITDELLLSRSFILETTQFYISW